MNPLTSSTNKSISCWQDWYEWWILMSYLTWRIKPDRTCRAAWVQCGQMPQTPVDVSQERSDQFTPADRSVMLPNLTKVIRLLLIITILIITGCLSWAKKSWVISWKHHRTLLCVFQNKICRKVVIQSKSLWTHQLLDIKGQRLKVQTAAVPQFLREVDSFSDHHLAAKCCRFPTTWTPTLSSVSINNPMWLSH